MTAGAGRFIVLVGLAVLILVTGTYIYIGREVLGDPDIWWHIKAGQEMLASAAPPHADHWTFTVAGQPWIAKEWLSQVLLALADRADGWNGVLLLACLSAGLAIYLLYREFARHLQPLAAAAFAVLIAELYTATVIARPHIFTLPLMVYFTARLFREAEAGKPPPFWLLALVVLWVNLHGSFTLSFVIAGFAVLQAVEAVGLSNRPVLARWVLFAVLCPVAALVNPYGLGPYAINLDMMRGNQAADMIVEWQPFNAQDTPLVKWGLLAVLAALLSLRQRLSWAKIGLILFLLNMMLTHIRFMNVFFLLVPLLIPRELAESYPALAIGRWLERPRDGLERAAGRHFAPLAASLSVAALAAFVLVTEARPFEPPERRTIKGAMTYVREHGLAEKRVLNGYNLGGMLIVNGIKPYIDGRSDQLFHGKMMADYLASADYDGSPILAQILRDNDIAWTIMPRTDIRNDFLRAMPGWKLAYEDKLAMIFERR